MGRRVCSAVRATVPIVVVLAWAGVAASGLAASISEEPVHTTTAPIHIGDALVYTRFRNDGTETWQATGAFEAQALRSESLLDADLETHSSIAMSFVSDESARTIVYVDPGTGQVVREDGALPQREADTAEWAGQERYSRYAEFPPHSVLLGAVVRFADAQINSDQDLSAWRSALQGILPPGEFERRMGPASEVWSLVPATYETRPVHILAQALTAQDPSDGSVQIERQVWLDADLPYPVGFKIKTTWLGADASTPFHGTLWLLTSFTPGNGPVFIPTPPSEPQMPPATPRAAASPPEGDAGLAFSLDDALARVLVEPTLVNFQRWRQSYPSAELIGYSYQPYQLRHDPLALDTRVLRYEWGFLFAAPTGQSAGVIVSRDEQTRTLFFKDTTGIKTVPAEVLRTKPQSFTAIEDAARQWRPLARDHGIDQEVNVVSWGWIMCTETEADDCSLDLMSTLRIGYHGPLEPGVYGVAGGDSSYAQLAVNTSTGHVLELTTTQDAAIFFEHYGEVVPAITPRTPGALSQPIPAGEVKFPTSALVSAGILLTALIAELFRRLLGFLPAYAKIARSNLLRHRTREHLVSFIRENPGATPSQMVQYGIAPWSTLLYHLRRLERAAIIRFVDEGPSRRCYEAAQFDVAKANRDAATRAPRSKAVIAIVNANPGISLAELSRHVGIKAPSMLSHVRRLERAGILRVERGAGRVAYFLR